ncbi:MAG: MauE/DoxX family redox-associated membrane protein [Bacillota bacterium]
MIFDYIVLIGRLFLSLIFISSSYYKLRNFTNHKSIILDYKIIPKKLIFPGVIIGMFLELIVGIGLFIGLFLKAISILTTLLLIVYILFISINLYRGRNINCGCGGVVGDNTISINMVYRNLFLITISLFLFIQNSVWSSIDGLLLNYHFKSIFSPSTIFIFCSFNLMALFLFISKNYKSLINQLQKNMR